MEKDIHFEGDEKWVFDGLPKIDDFFYGWFRGKKGKLLEAGCGVGNFVVTFSKLGFNVIGIEYSQERAEIAKENCKKYLSRAKIVCGDVRNMPFKNCEFDLVFSHGVVEHFPDTQTALNEINRVLKGEGYAMISVPNRMSVFVLNKLAQMWIGALINRRIWNCGYEQSFTKNKFRSMLKDAGFEVLDQRTSEIAPGKRFPWYGKILNLLDKPGYLIGLGGNFTCFFVKKVKQK